MRNIREILVQKLWDGFRTSVPEYEGYMSSKPVLDHMAIIDVTSENSNRLVLEKILSKIGFQNSGNGYLPEKFNDFLWMRAEDAHTYKVTEALPQLVFADFRIEGHSKKVQDIIAKYVVHQQPFDFERLDELLKTNDHEAVANHIYNFICQRPWSTPTVEDYLAVKDENQLLSWALLFGKKVNHFGVNISVENKYNSLQDFNTYLKGTNLVQINNIDGEVKGTRDTGIQQSSTVGKPVKYTLADGEIEVTDSFMEFVWRYPVNENPVMWNDYFTGFVAQNANRVIESLYDEYGS